MLKNIRCPVTVTVGLQWSSTSEPEGIVLPACAGQDVDIDWDYTTTNTEHVVNIEYRFQSTLGKLVKKEKENCTVLTRKKKSHCRRKSSARGSKSKVSSESLSPEIDILIRLR